MNRPPGLDHRDEIAKKEAEARVGPGHDACDGVLHLGDPLGSVVLGLEGDDQVIARDRRPAQLQRCRFGGQSIRVKWYRRGSLRGTAQARLSVPIGPSSGTGTLWRVERTEPGTEVQAGNPRRLDDPVGDEHLAGVGGGDRLGRVNAQGDRRPPGPESGSTADHCQPADARPSWASVPARWWQRRGLPDATLLIEERDRGQWSLRGMGCCPGQQGGPGRLPAGCCPGQQRLHPWVSAGCCPGRQGAPRRGVATGFPRRGVARGNRVSSAGCCPGQQAKRYLSYKPFREAGDRQVGAGFYAGYRGCRAAQITPRTRAGRGGHTPGVRCTQPASPTQSTRPAGPGRRKLLTSRPGCGSMGVSAGHADLRTISRHARKKTRGRSESHVHPRVDAGDADTTGGPDSDPLAALSHEPGAIRVADRHRLFLRA